LALALVALTGAGLFSVLLVAARTPLLQHFFPAADFFRTALVVHVDLSVLVWFFAIAGVLWSLNSTPRAIGLGWAALGLAGAGAALMCVAPFADLAVPIMSNYVPVLDGPWFLAGLAAFGAGIALLALRALATAPPVGVALDGAAALRFGLNAAAVAAAMALLAFAWSWLAVPGDLPARGYYDILFWGAGHVAQFAYTLLMLVAWLALAEAAGIRVPISPRIAVLLFGVGLAAVFVTPVIYLAWNVTSVEHRRLFTWLMEWGGGLAIVPFALGILWGAARGGRARDPRTLPPRAALLASLVLFGTGGAIGFVIHGSDVTIPAHYHGSIVGVTLALMGLVYLLLPRLGYREPDPGWARWQPYLYGCGQLLHIAGLLWSGGYGVQRKVAGGEQVLRSAGEIAGMGLMGLGGLVALAGGLLFVVIVLRAMWGGSRERGGGSGAGG
ncbi:MAG TPA: cbb3-type cytochrome c oxidase subunit I, partial [Burkholderiales bacterium]|nr:cbb3-type cytochrome c oxidase subunit I [Burkholderiales bacterium]